MIAPVHLFQTLTCMVIVALCLNTGCATPYQPFTAWSYRGGYVDQQLSQDTFFVGFYGNGFTDARAAGDYVLYRCAELADQAGADHFIAIGGEPTGKNPLNIDIHVVGFVPIPVPVHRPFSTVYVRVFLQPPTDLKQKTFKTKDVLESLRSKVHRN